MNPETAYKISTAILWLCIAVNVWSLMRNIRERKRLLQATKEFVRMNGELIELRERLTSDDRNEDGEHGREND